MKDKAKEVLFYVALFLPETIALVWFFYMIITKTKF